MTRPYRPGLPELAGEPFRVPELRRPARSTLRYGENPHQAAASISPPERAGVATARQVQGKELSYNNINDTDAAYELRRRVRPVGERRGARSSSTPIPAASPPRRRSPRRIAGLPLRPRLRLRRRGRAEPAARRRGAPRKSSRSSPRSSSRRKRATRRGRSSRRRRISACSSPAALPDPRAPGLTAQTVAGGFLVQDRDDGMIGESRPEGGHQARADRGRDRRPSLRLAGRQARQVERHRLRQGRSHRRDRRRPDEPRRCGAIAARKAEEAAKAAGLPESLAKGSVVASDAFFPFPDGLIAAAEAGATAVIQPGGSMRDDLVIAAADERGLAMVFTGMRHFRH